MLKIKDNVDLKELEKYGIKKHKKDDNEILVSLWHREIEYDQDYENYMDYKQYFEFYTIFKVLKDNRRIVFPYSSRANIQERQINLIYKLTKAGLVEKVEE